MLAASSLPLTWCGMHVAFPALGGFGRKGLLRQPFDDAGGDLDGVDHFVLGEARVHVDPGYFYFQRVGAEGFILDFPHFFAVDRVAEIGADLGRGDVLHSPARLFVGSENDLEVRPRQFRMVVQPGQDVHDDGDAGLVVGAQQGVARRGDDGLADLFQQIRVFAGF